MNGKLPDTPLFEGLTVAQHHERSRSYDTALVAMEGIVVAGANGEDARGLRAAMLHAYCVRIGAIIAGCEAPEQAALKVIAREEIDTAVEIIRMLRS